MLINQGGGATEIVYDGSSGVRIRKGEPVLLMESFAEDFAIYDTEAEYEALELPASMNRTSLVYRGACRGVKD